VFDGKEAHTVQGCEVEDGAGVVALEGRTLVGGTEDGELAAVCPAPEDDFATGDVHAVGERARVEAYRYPLVIGVELFGRDKVGRVDGLVGVQVVVAVDIDPAAIFRSDEEVLAAIAVGAQGVEHGRGVVHWVIVGQGIEVDVVGGCVGGYGGDVVVFAAGGEDEDAGKEGGQEPMGGSGNWVAGVVFFHNGMFLLLCRVIFFYFTHFHNKNCIVHSIINIGEDCDCH